MKKWQSIPLYLGAFLTLNFICKWATDGFSTQDLVEPTSRYHSQEPDDVQKILGKKFSYLGKGKQAYAFVSDDGAYVLKVFRPYFPSLYYKDHRISISKAPGIRILVSYLFREEIERKKHQDFQSYITCYESFAKETQLSYIHLDTTNHLQQRITIFDKIGVLHYLDADTTCFLVQKKANLLYPTLSSYIQKGQIEEAKELISSFLELNFSLLSKGVDYPTIAKENWGCIGSQAVLIDVGRVICKESSVKSRLEDIDRCARPLYFWLTKAAPHLCEYVDNQIQTYKEKS